MKIGPSLKREVPGRDVSVKYDFPEEIIEKEVKGWKKKDAQPINGLMQLKN